MPRARKIAVGALEAQLPASGGIQRFSAELLRELAARDPQLVAFVTSTRLAQTHSDRFRETAPRSMGHGSFAGNLLRFGWHQTVLPAALRRQGAGVYFSTVPDGMLSPVCPQVVTVHDLIPLRFPQSSPRLRHYFHFVVPRVLRASAAIITMSEATRRDLNHFFGIGGDRVHVVYQGYRAELFQAIAEAEVERVRHRLGLGRYLLAVGEGRPYKNLPRLLEAFALSHLPGVELVVVGRPGRREVDLPSLAARLGIAERVRFPGFVSDRKLAHLYAGAEAFVFPSLYEGFGIPPLEAMACGCPVVSSDRASMPEVCGDAAVYFDPCDPRAIARGIERVLGDEDLRQRLRRKGFERAQHFSYGTAAERILEILRAPGLGEGRIGGD